MLKTFLYPALNNEMRLDHLRKGYWQQLDYALRPHLNSALYLSVTVTNDYMYETAAPVPSQ